jgi:YesN/AraC family two-component response regulator
MSIDNEIIIIEDDEDDREFLGLIINEVLEKNNFTNKVVFLNDGMLALEYFNSQDIDPFIIISDINMPKLNGLDLREIIYNDVKLSSRCTPYVFLTTSYGSQENINRAFKLSVQGFFVKPNDYNDYTNLMEDIIKYWKRSHKPVLEKQQVNHVA